MSDRRDDKLANVVDSIVSSYATDARTQRIGKTYLPSRSVIVELIEQARQLVFPGFFGQKKLTEENIRFHVGSLVSRFLASLTEQINHCMCVDRACEGECEEAEACRRKASMTAKSFMTRIPHIRDMLALDAQAAYDGDPAARSVDEVIYCYPGFFAMAVYRIAHELLAVNVPLMPRMMSEYAHSVTGADIHPGAQIGRSFFIDHATGVVIGETAKIGDNVKIYQGVTLGALSFPKDERGRVIKGLQRHPTIEDGATIYANATILGGQTVIGRGVEVSGNTFITKSVTEHSVVAHDAPKLRVVRKRAKRSSSRETKEDSQDQKR